MTETSGKVMGGMTVVEVVKSVKKKNVPKSAFSVPKGYRRLGPAIKPSPQMPQGGYR